MSLLVDEQGSDGHRGLKLQCLPIGGIKRQGDGIIADRSLSLGTQGGTFLDHIHQLTGYGNLTLWLFRERYTDGVANAFSEQGTDTHSTLDTTVLAFASLCDTKMQGIVHLLLVHGLDKQTHGGHHHHGIGSLDRDHHIIKVLALKNAEELHTTLNDTLGGVAITAHDSVGE